MADFFCSCCGDQTDGLFPLLDPAGMPWCGICWEHEYNEERIAETGFYVPDICYRHEWDEDWANHLEETYG